MYNERKMLFFAVYSINALDVTKHGIGDSFFIMAFSVKFSKSNIALVTRRPLNVGLLGVTWKFCHTCKG